MKVNLIIILILSALFVFSCESKQTLESTENTNPKNNMNTTIQSKEITEDMQVKVKSENSFDVTYANLKKVIESKKPLKIIAELDHSANAKKAELELRPTKIIMFGNPNLGTPLMQTNQAIGLDLPQKMLVYEDEKGDVFVVYNNPKIVAANSKITGKEEILNKISGALKGLAGAATKKADN